MNFYLAETKGLSSHHLPSGLSRPRFVNKINAAYYVPRCSVHHSDVCVGRAELIAQIAHNGLPEVARTKVFRLSDPTQLGRLIWCNKPKSILAYDDDPMVREGDWSKDADISQRLVVWFNSEHPIFAFINDLYAMGQKTKAEAYVRYLYYRLLTKQHVARLLLQNTGLWPKW